MHEEYLESLYHKLGLRDDAPVEAFVLALRELPIDERSVIHTELIVRHTICLNRHQKEEEKELREVVKRLDSHDERISALDTATRAIITSVESFRSELRSHLGGIAMYFNRIETELSSRKWFHWAMVSGIVFMILWLIFRTR